MHVGVEASLFPRSAVFSFYYNVTLFIFVLRM